MWCELMLVKLTSCCRPFFSDWKLNLKKRKENQGRLINMETESRRTVWGGNVRAEVEVPLSQETIEKGVSELKIPPQPPGPTSQTTPFDPIELLKSKGL